MSRCAGLLTVAIFVVVATCAWAQLPGAGPNVNMVSGTDWTTGDPFLQRQNEPSIAVSTRNPSHLLAGANDYRSVDYEELLQQEINGEPTPDAWLGVFKSFDGGATWASTLLPGFPLDSTQGAAPGGPKSPLSGLQAAADPIVRAGTNGMFYYAGIGFNRGTNIGKVFVARFIDNNNKENGNPTQTTGSFTAVSPTDPMRYLGTIAVQSGGSTQFLDKPWLAVDVPRGSSTCNISYTNPDGTPGSQTIPASNVYITFTDFVTTTVKGVTTTQSAILFTRSTNCGSNWSTPIALSGMGVNQGSVIAVAPPIPGTESLLPPLVYVAWRQFGSGNTPNAIMMAESLNGGVSFTPAFAAHTFPLSCNTTPTGAGCPFDQGITGTSFRTNAYPTLAADTTGRMYLAWSQRQANGDARIMMQVGLVGIPLPPPALVDNGSVLDDFGHPLSNLSGRGHQIMPSLSFNAGKLMMIYYDLRQDHTIGQFVPQANLTSYSETRFFEGELSSGDPADPSVFNFYVDDAGEQQPTHHPLTIRRHTIDLQGAQATPLAPLNLGVPAFSAFRISHYAFGINPYDNPTVAEQLEVSPPNLPMFQTGTVPFMGDYIDVAGAPPFVLANGKWHFNTSTAAGLPVFHAAWTDNRNVRPPKNGDWTQYTPPYSLSNPSGGTQSKFDPTKTTLTCNSNFVASRNQDIYTSRIAPGLVVLIPGNQKPLSTTLQRAFSVVVENTTSVAKSFRLTIANRPLLANGSVDPQGQATFQQLPIPSPTVTTLDVQANALSTVAGTVFVKSQNPTASVTINVQEISGGQIVSGGLTGAAIINPDPTTPPLINPDNSVSNPSISTLETYNPTLNPAQGNPAQGNPAQGNPAQGNTELLNQNIQNPAQGNPAQGNPAQGNQAITAALNPAQGNATIENPAQGNVAVANPAQGNQSVSDVNLTLSNEGNTTATYKVNLFGSNPSNLLLQLIVSKIYYLNEPGGADGCTLQVQPTNVILSNIPNPTVVTNPNDLVNPAQGNPAQGNTPTVAVPPGETVQVTLRLSQGNNLPPPTQDQVNQLLNNVTPVVVSQSTNTQSLGSPNPQPPISLTITTKTLPSANTGVAYSQQLMAMGGVTNPPGNYTWTLISGSLPGGLTLDPTGLIHGTPTTGASASFVVQVMDTASPPHTAQQALSILAPLSFTPTAMQTADVGQSFTEDLSSFTIGGAQPYTYSITSGSLPPSLSLNGSIISGMFTTPGSYGFTLKVTDSLGVTASQASNITVNAPPMVTTAFLPTAEQGYAYSTLVTASGGTPPLTFTPTKVDGVSLSASGLLTGMPLSAGPYPVSVTVTDALGVSSNSLLALPVNAPTSLASAALPAGIQGVAYPSQQLVASNGVPPYSNWSWAPTAPSSTLPPGLTLSASGAISGTPTAAGTFSFTVSVADMLGATASQMYSINVCPASPSYSPDFTSSQACLTLNGSASFSPPTVLQLTPAATGQAGSAWYNIKQTVTSAFSTTFTFQLSNTSTYNADGIAFVIQNSALTALGPSGCGIGFGDDHGDCAGPTGGIPNSVAVVFKTFDNGYPTYYPNTANSVSILSNGTGANCVDFSCSIAANNSLPAEITLADGIVHTVTVSYSGTMLDVILDSHDLFPGGVAFDMTTIFSAPASNAWVGFTAGTGGGDDTQDILSWTFSPSF